MKEQYVSTQEQGVSHAVHSSAILVGETLLKQTLFYCQKCGIHSVSEISDNDTEKCGHG